jgi:hypothetical protein
VEAQVALIMPVAVALVEQFIFHQRQCQLDLTP